MQRDECIKLLNKVPETMLDQVVLSVSTGIDVYIQRLLQTGEEALLLRGRLGGSDEGERIFLIPWPEIKMLFFSRPVEDYVLFSIFGDLIGGVRKSLGAQTKKEDEEQDEEARPMPVRLPAPPTTPEPSKASVDVSEIRNKLLQPRKPPPRTETNKPIVNKPQKG
jgi:hypothetical protein